MIKVIAFDVFGTVFDMKDVPVNERRAYGEHLRNPAWSPLVLPESWERIPAHPDARRGLADLRKKWTVVAMTNAPARTLVPLSRHNGIVWDAAIPLQAYKVFKPNAEAYPKVAEYLGVPTSEIMMVTANRTFGDIEGAAACGMVPQLIRDGLSPIRTIEDLYAHLVASDPETDPGRTYRVIAVSTNANSFGLRSMIVADRQGRAWRVLANGRHVREKGTDLRVPHDAHGEPQWAMIGGENPERLVDVPADVLAEIYPPT